MRSLIWTSVSLGVLLPAIALHNWANARRPLAARSAARGGSHRWWLPWPRRAEFPDDRTWRVARGAQVALYGWAVGAVVGAVASLGAALSAWRAG